MMLSLLALLIIAGVVFYYLTPEERARAVRVAAAAILKAKDATFTDRRDGGFAGALLERTPRALVTPFLIAVNIGVFLFMLFGPGAFSDPATLIAWGGNFGPLTTNGEWRRLATSMFVHTSLVHLLVNVVCLAQLGLVLERLVGRLTFLSAYFAAGMLASLVSVAMYPMAVNTGASGAIFGVYGLFVASAIWGMRSGSTVSIPLVVIKRVGVAAGVFVLYNMAAGGRGLVPDIAGLLVGLVYGVTLTRGIAEHKPAIRRIAGVMTATAVIVVAFGVPLRGIDDVRPEIARLVTVEDRTASVYESALARFRIGRLSAVALAELVDRTIIPELQAADARLQALDGVPSEHRPLVAPAEKYLRLREESWRLRAEGLREMVKLTRESRPFRAEGLHTASIATLRKAESAERAALKALEEIKPAGG